MDIKKLIPNWSELVFSKANYDGLNLKADIKKRISKEFDSLNISNSKMDGFCTEGLPKTSETGSGLNYSTIFHKLVAKKNFSPALFLAQFTNDYLKSNLDEKRLNGFLSRGLRTFASLIREQDFANKLEINLKKIDNSVKVLMDPEQDTKSHVDIKLIFKSKEFNLWTYQASKNAIYPHTIERVTGQRGELENGVHILCPISTELGNVLLNKRKSLNIQTERLNKWKLDLKNKKTKKQIEDHQNKINKKVEEIENIKVKIKEIESQTKYLDIINGWFLYSDNYISEISNMIINFNKQNVINYKNLNEDLLKAEKILRSVTFFKK